MSPELPRRVALPGRADLLVREMGRDDVDGIAELYERLDPEDHYRRFFTACRPDREFFERMVAVGARGGGGLVVVDTGATSQTDRGGGDGQVIGESSYELLTNGNGEVEIVVDPRWRGWLGPYLLALLGRLAAARGVTNLEAEILTVNRPMRALTLARGEAIRPGSDWRSVRVVFSATGDAPNWGRSDSQRVLVEAAHPAWDALDALAADGVDVLACRGPERRAVPCPLLSGGACPLAGGADAIVLALPPGPTRDGLAAAHRAGHSVPVVTVDTDGADGDVAALIVDAARRALATSGPRLGRVDDR